jgi:hypothetical protein
METLGKHFRNLTAAAFQSHGFAQADVLGRWDEIVGKALAAAARPERIRWPRGSKATGSGTLVVKALAGRGLEVQQAVPLIIERINRFLGYGAIMAVRIHQSQDLKETVQPKALPVPLPAAPPGIAEPELAAALQRLGGGVRARSDRSSQGR